MSVTGIYVECNRQAAATGCDATIYTGAPAWVENLTSAGTTTNAVPALLDRPFVVAPTYTLRIHALVSAYVRVGPDVVVPGPDNGVWLNLGEVLTYTASPGDRVSWAPTGHTYPPIFTIGAQGTYAERGDYDTEDAGFVYLSTNGDAGATTTLASLFARVGATPGVWSDIIPFQGPTGATGPAGPAGADGPDLTERAPAITADTMLVDNAAGTARETKTFTEVVETLGLTYIKDYGSHSVALRKFRTTYTDPSDWTEVLQAAADSGEPCIRVHADDEVTFDDQWTISTAGQKWVGDGMDKASRLRRTTDVDEAAIVVTGERCGFRHIALYGVDYTSRGGVAKTAANAGISVARPAGARADLDFEFRNGVISKFYYGISSFGRGVTLADSLISYCRYAVNYDWPAAGTYSKDNFTGDGDANGFRRLIFARNQLASLGVGGVRNRGWNAANAQLVIQNNNSNFGKSMFEGYLGPGSIVSGNSISNHNFIAYTIDGGADYTFDGNTVVADPSASGGFTAGNNFIKMTGTHTDFVIKNFHGVGCLLHGIDMRSGDFRGVLRDIDLRDIGRSAASSYSGIIAIGTGSATDLFADGVTLRMTSAAQNVIRMNTSGSTLKYHACYALGAATTVVGGPGTSTAV